MPYDYTPLFLNIREQLNRLDPIGLGPGDLAPEDEYDPEVAEIVSLLPQALSPRDLAERMHRVFIFYFDEQMAGPLTDYLPIAREIWDSYKREAATHTE